MKMKLLLLAFVIAASMQSVQASAITTSNTPHTVCPPTPTTDTIAITASCGLDPLLAVPNARYWVGWNDNPVGLPNNDWDFCDLCAYLAVNADGTSALLTYIGQAASSHLTMYYGSTALFTNFSTVPGATALVTTTPNEAILFSLHVDYVHGGHYDFSSTDRNYFRDGCISESCAPQGDPPPDVPEVATLLTGGLGLCLVGFARKTYGARPR